MNSCGTSYTDVFDNKNVCQKSYRKIMYIFFPHLLMVLINIGPDVDVDVDVDLKVWLHFT